MRISSGDICSYCKHFEHSCDSSSDMPCTELCHSEDPDVREQFYDLEIVIHDCKDFK